MRSHDSRADHAAKPLPPVTSAITGYGTDDDTYVLRLYVTGMTPRSSQAISNIKAVCMEHLAGRYELEVIDVYDQPSRVRDEQILATPTLIKQLPQPARRFIGDLSNTDRVLIGLGLEN